MVSRIKWRNAVSAILLVLWCCWPVLAADPPDSEINYLIGKIEVTDATDDGGNFDIRHIIDPGKGQSKIITTLTSDERDDLSPRLTISDDGHTWIVWYREGSTDEVLIRKFTFLGGGWADEQQVSLRTESSRNPEIIHDGLDPWVVYEFDSSGETAIAARVILDDPVPVGARKILTTTGFAGDLDTRIIADSGHLWVTWVNSSSEVGWSEYDYSSESWSAPANESYANDSIREARERIRDTVAE